MWFSEVKKPLWADNTKNGLNGYTGQALLRNVLAMIGAPIGGRERGGVTHGEIEDST